MITRENYEIFLIDYIDGKLDTVKAAELLVFLSENPDIEDDFNNLERINITPAEPGCFNTSFLKKDLNDVKEITSKNYEEFIIAKFENDLNPDDIKRIDEFISNNPKYEQDVISFKKVFLSPDSTIQYKDKHKLKKSIPVFRVYSKYIYLAASVAAAVLLLFTVLKPFEHQSAPIQATIFSDTEPDSENKQEKVQTKITIPDNPDHFTEIQSIKKDIPKVPTLQEKDITLTRQIISEREEIPQFLAIKTELIPVNSADNNEIISMLTQPKTIGQKPIIENRNNPLSKINTFLNDKNILTIEKVDFWSAINLGLKGFNNLTEAGVELKKETDNNGMVTAYALESENFSVRSTSKSKF
ncbi:MAG: hypothetical protein JXJ22_18740 [Bacteroidales bacterium]|nr:hypothetical protein [Bacteroidales bacterium]